jgi:hypothetical protein
MSQCVSSEAAKTVGCLGQTLLTHWHEHALQLRFGEVVDEFVVSRQQQTKTMRLMTQETTWGPNWD